MVRHSLHVKHCSGRYVLRHLRGQCYAYVRLVLKLTSITQLSLFLIPFQAEHSFLLMYGYPYCVSEILYKAQSVYGVGLCRYQVRTQQVLHSYLFSRGSPFSHYVTQAYFVRWFETFQRSNINSCSCAWLLSWELTLHCSLSIGGLNVMQRYIVGMVKCHTL